MIAIPLPFIASLLMAILAVVLFQRRKQSTQAAFVFIALCAVTSALVGFRWTTDVAIFKALQPVFASCIPVVAWYCFTRAHNQKKLLFFHILTPILVLLGSLIYPFWHPSIDPILTIMLDLILTVLYVGYGVALIRASLNRNEIPEQVRLSDVENAQKAERYAGLILIVAASVDGVIAFDFVFYNGAHVLNIIAISYFIMLPLLAGTVAVVSLSMPENKSDEANNETEGRTDEVSKAVPVKSAPFLALTENEINEIVSKINKLITVKEVFLDPDLTLDRLARKAGIPAKKISIAINQSYGRNISQVMNEYRIERAKQLLVNTNKPITQVYFDSGFQTKSNFNREFIRLTQQTPSAFRRSQQGRAV